MSEALFQHGGLRFWDEAEIDMREAFIKKASGTVKKTLLDLNSAWKFYRCEGPILHPRNEISSSYTDDDIFITNHKDFCLRAETTPSSYAYARNLPSKIKMPICVWQSGISSRRENLDGATAAKLRFNNFWQLEFQCIYSKGTMADYRGALIPAIAKDIGFFTQCETRVVDSDRLPSYSNSTLDIEAYITTDSPCQGLSPGWREMSSCSIRTDYNDDTLVAEIAIGLDRVIELGMCYQ